MTEAARLAIITGLSGAGRTTAAKVLEDLGYFVIDNLPPSLIERVVDLATAPGSMISKVALVVDVRGRHAFRADGDDALGPALAAVGKRGVDVRVLFLEAGDDVLVRRYEAARRAHPLAPNERVVEGIARERAILDDLRADADLVVDTTDLTVHTLRQRLVDAFGEDGASERLALNVLSFGFKNGTPRDADLLLDVRFLPNPHWISELRPLTGLAPAVKDYVLGQPETGEFLRRLFALLEFLVPAYEREGKHYLTIGIGCTGGKHRSVTLAEVLGDHLRTLGVGVQVEHRDVGRE